MRKTESRASLTADCTALFDAAVPASVARACPVRIAASAAPSNAGTMCLIFIAFLNKCAGRIGEPLISQRAAKAAVRPPVAAPELSNPLEPLWELVIFPKVTRRLDEDRSDPRVVSLSMTPCYRPANLNRLGPEPDKPSEGHSRSGGSSHRSSYASCRVVEHPTASGRERRGDFVMGQQCCASSYPSSLSALLAQ